MKLRARLKRSRPETGEKDFFYKEVAELSEKDFSGATKIRPISSLRPLSCCRPTKTNMLVLLSRMASVAAAASEPALNCRNGKHIPKQK